MYAIILAFSMFNFSLKKDRCTNSIEIHSSCRVNNKIIFDKNEKGQITVNNYPNISVRIHHKSDLEEYLLTDISDNMSYVSNELVLTKKVFELIKTPEKLDNFKSINRKRSIGKLGEIENHRISFDYERQYYILEYEHFGFFLTYSAIVSHPHESPQNEMIELISVKVNKKIRSKCLNR